MKQVEFDPNFGIIASPPDRGPRSRSGRSNRSIILVRWLVAYPALAFIALNVVVMIVMTIKPFSSADRLNHPTAVVGVTLDGLTLADRRRVAVPFIKAIPASNPVFLAALARGVEVDADGEVYGLLKIRPSCGMTAYRYHLRRTSLSELAGALDPANIDDVALGPDEVTLIRDQRIPYVPTDPANVRDIIRSNLDIMGRSFSFARTERSSRRVPN